jgi:DNA-binding NarL/FixJ family response regulator
MSNTVPKRIGLIEDDQIIRTYLAALLQSQEGVTSAKGWSSAEEFLESPDRHDLDMLLVDLQLPGESGISLIRRLHTEQPGLCCIVLTASSDPRQVFDSLRHGASGYLVKHGGPDELLRSLRSVMQDGVTLSPTIAKLLVEEFFKGSNSLVAKELDRTEALTRLTKRELEVLETIAKRGNAKDAAAELGLSHETVRVHMKKIYQKLHVKCKAEAVAVLAQARSIPIDIKGS